MKQSLSEKKQPTEILITAQWSMGVRVKESFSKSGLENPQFQCGPELQVCKNISKHNPHLKDFLLIERRSLN